MTTRPTSPTRASIAAARDAFGARHAALSSTSPGGAWAHEALLLAEDAMSEALAARNERLLDAAQAVECRRALEAIAADQRADERLRTEAAAAIDRARRAL